ncbi:MAG: hypothetical protein ACI8XO_000457 [Verrucomicrobiales bacterium]|jgi:uncharacterized protein involved in response to NO
MPPRCRFAKTARPQVSVCTEPFRIFFPLGILASLVGVLLWPLLYAGGLNFYPNEAHARLMVQGFVGSFALGFLGTAFPKMIGSPSLTRYELALFATVTVGGSIAHGFNLIAYGDACFLLLWLAVATCLGTRLAFFRDSLPPPGFVLAAMGIFAGITGTILLLVGRISTLTEFQRALAPLLLNEAFILGPILGVGGFLFPRFFTPTEDRDRKPWRQRANFHLVIGLLLLGTLVSQAAGSETLAPLARAGIVLAILFANLPMLRRGTSTGSLSTMLRLALLLVVIGIAASLAPPAARIAAKHTLFIGGYGMLILAVASRVTWGHSGNIALAEGRRRSLQVIIWVLLFAFTTRVVAGFIPTIRVSHHIYAALLWSIAVGIWTWAVLKYIRVADPED